MRDERFRKPIKRTSWAGQACSTYRVFSTPQCHTLSSRIFAPCSWMFGLAEGFRHLRLAPRAHPWATAWIHPGSARAVTEKQSDWAFSLRELGLRHPLSVVIAIRGTRNKKRHPNTSALNVPRNVGLLSCMQIRRSVAFSKSPHGSRLQRTPRNRETMKKGIRLECKAKCLAPKL